MRMLTPLCCLLPQTGRVSCERLRLLGSKKISLPQKNAKIAMVRFRATPPYLSLLLFIFVFFCGQRNHRPVAS